MKSKDILADIWPSERNIIETPHRLKYVRRVVNPKTCVFCDADRNSKSPDSLVLYKDRSWMVLLNKYPYNNGHILIVPRRHVADFEKLSDKDLSHMQVLMKNALKILRKTYNPNGFNLGMNLGEVAGAGIPNHLHYHAIPRWAADTNFFPLIAETKLVVETCEQSYNRLKPAFAALEKKRAL